MAAKRKQLIAEREFAWAKHIRVLRGIDPAACDASGAPMIIEWVKRTFTRPSWIGALAKGRLAGNI
jgi:hypothetical protein